MVDWFHRLKLDSCLNSRISRNGERKNGEALFFCLGQCVKKLPIPDLMRAFMYLYGYRNLVEAQDLLSSLSLPASLCGDCGSCSVKCLNRWNVSERIQNVVRLREVPPEFIA